MTENYVFDVGIHVRNQFGHFESNSETENSNAAISAAYDYMNSTKYHHFLKNILAKLHRTAPR